MTHPHDTLIRSWLDGKRVQYLDDRGIWVTLEPAATAKKLPHFYADRQYRQSPMQERYRIAVMSTTDKPLAMAHSLMQAELLEKSPRFVRWHDDWQVVHVQ